MKKYLTLIIAAAMLLTACGDQGSSNETTTQDNQTDTEQSSTALEYERANTPDNLPKADFGGESFVITINNYTGCEEGFLAEELNGEVLNDAVFRRNLAVQDRFNIKLEIISDKYDQLVAKVNQSVSACEDYYQLLNQHVNTAAGWVNSEILMNWYDLPYVDFENPWWSDSNANDLTVNGCAYLAVGDYGLTTLGRTYAMYYDTVEAEAYKLPDLYEIVYNGEWTVDRMMEYTKDTYRDMNSNGQRDTVEDFFGFTSATGSNINAFLWAFGGKIIEDGEIVFGAEKTTDIVAKLIDLYHNSEGTCFDKTYKNAQGNSNYIGVEKMAQGTTLFSMAMIDSGILYLRDSVHDYGILPLPKWDEAQLDYITIVDPGFTAMAVPKTVVDTERVGILAEALCAETYRQVIPAYYESAIKQKGARNEESIAMMDYILSKRIYDFGIVYDGGKGFYWTVSGLVSDNNPNFASRYAQNISSVTAYYEKLFELFE